MAKGGCVLEIVGAVHGYRNDMVGVEIVDREFLPANETGVVVALETLDSILGFPGVTSAFEIVVISTEVLCMEGLTTIFTSAPLSNIVRITMWFSGHGPIATTYDFTGTVMNDIWIRVDSPSCIMHSTHLSTVEGLLTIFNGAGLGIWIGSRASFV